ncbi:MAG: hypothetical protein GY804_08600 [Alphaproteobacteria bacterium]|nr:hypothetical protein [Alphaproteobacteria bacterium]
MDLLKTEYHDEITHDDIQELSRRLTRKVMFGDSGAKWYSEIEYKDLLRQPTKFFGPYKDLKEDVLDFMMSCPIVEQLGHTYRNIMSGSLQEFIELKKIFKDRKRKIDSIKRGGLDV